MSNNTESPSAGAKPRTLENPQDFECAACGTLVMTGVMASFAGEWRHGGCGGKLVVREA